MKILKRISIIIVSVLAVVFLLLLILPLLFHSQFIGALEKQASEQIKGTFYFDKNNSGISLIYSFPNVQANIVNFYMLGEGEFKNDTLIAGKSLTVTLDISGAIFGYEPKLRRIVADQPRIYARMNRDGLANWDISKQKKDTATLPKKEDTKETYRESIRYWEVKNGYISYKNEKDNVKLVIQKLNHQANAFLEQDVSDLTAKLEMENIQFQSNGISFLPPQNLKIDLILETDQLNRKYTFKENSIQLNELVIKLEGFVQDGKEGLFTDVQLKSSSGEFKNFISLFCNSAQYSTLESKGDFIFEAFVKGNLQPLQNKSPAFGMALKIKDGQFHFSNLNLEAKNVQLDFNMEQEQNKMGNVKIQLKTLEAFAGNNHIKMDYTQTGTGTDMYLLANVNMIDLKEIIPLKSTLDGKLKADIRIKNSLPLKVDANLQYGSYEYDKFKIEDLEMNLISKEQKIILEDLHFKLLGGTFSAKGDYEDSKTNKSFQLGVLIEKISFEKITEAFPQIKEKNPDIVNLKAFTSSKINISNNGDSLFFATKSMRGDAEILIEGLEIKENQQLKLLTNFVTLDLPIQVGDFQIKLNLDNQLVNFQSTDIQTKDNVQINVDGSVNTSEDMDSKVLVQIPADKLNILASVALLRMAKKSEDIGEARKIYLNFHVFGKLSKLDFELESVSPNASGETMADRINGRIKRMRDNSAKVLKGIQEMQSK